MFVKNGIVFFTLFVKFLLSILGDDKNNKTFTSENQDNLISIIPIKRPIKLFNKDSVSLNYVENLMKWEEGYEAKSSEYVFCSQRSSQNYSMEGAGCLQQHPVEHSITDSQEILTQKSGTQPREKCLFQAFLVSQMS